MERQAILDILDNLETNINSLAKQVADLRNYVENSEHTECVLKESVNGLPTVANPIPKPEWDPDPSIVYYLNKRIPKLQKQSVLIYLKGYSPLYGNDVQLAFTVHEVATDRLAEYRIVYNTADLKRLYRFIEMNFQKNQPGHLVTIANAFNRKDCHGFCIRLPGAPVIAVNITWVRAGCKVKPRTYWFNLADFDHLDYISRNALLTAVPH